MPRVSAVMGLYNGAKYLRECIESIQNQTFEDWEFIIVNEYESDDGSVEIIKEYQKKDDRIILIQNEAKLGLAESLNVGIRQSKGEYIARVDDDDPSYPMRFEKQVKFMDENPDISLCGAIQRTVTPKSKTIQYVPCEPEELKAALLFGCEISHCVVMLRKKDFIENNWEYSSEVLGEDYDLWTRIMTKAKFANLNEVLVDHRWGYDNISIAKGERLRQEVREINARTLKLLDIDMANKNLLLLSGWNHKPELNTEEEKLNFLKNGFELLELIENQNKKVGIFNQEALMKILYKRWNWICTICGLKFKEYDSDQFKNITTTPIVSVIMPVYNSMKYLREAIDSVLDQTFTDWEFLVINEYGSNDGSSEIVQAYAKYDSRIKLIQNEERLGLGDSLNKGFKMAKGKYLARLDADDLAHIKRFEKQVEVMQENPNIGVCGTYQHHFGPETNWIHKPPTTPEQCRANILFYCDVCHSTLMLRKDVFIKNNLFYDNNFLAEDFELWTRAVAVTDFTTIPEVLGEYRWGEDNITHGKRAKLREESGHIVAKSLKQNLNMDIPEEDHILFGGWDNLYQEENDSVKRKQLLDRFKIILLSIWETNKKVKFYDEQALLNILSAKWKWAMYNEAWSNPQNVLDINEVFDPNYKPSFRLKWKRFLVNNPTLKLKIKKIGKKSLKKFAQPFRRRIEAIVYQSEANICNYIEWKTWDRYQRLEELITVQCDRLERKIDSKVWQAEKRIIELQNTVAEHYFNKNLQVLKPGEKIRIVFLFQVASFWPSTESFYNECIKDERFEVVVVCYDQEIDPTIKVETAREYLEDNQIEYIHWLEFDLSNFKPHIVVLQTPYDTNRNANYTSKTLKEKGIRTIYIPYGIEIADTNHARQAHFNENVVKNSWRIYTFSNRMLEDYKEYCINSEAVRCLGLPKFDNLYYKHEFVLNPDIKMQANGRKIVLWKVHFPKVIRENEENILVTPYIEEYLKFAEAIKDYKDLFFVFMPHPRFAEFNDDVTIKEQTEKLIEKVSVLDNVYIDEADDYRPSLLNADYIIIDRSAVMVEAAAVGVPVLYISNPDFYEPLTKAIEPLIESYYQGTTYEDIHAFLEMCRFNKDVKKWEREAAFRQCIPFFDGKCGERIKEDIIAALNEEETELLVEIDEEIKDIRQELKEVKNNFKEVESNILKATDRRIWTAELRMQKNIRGDIFNLDYAFKKHMKAAVESKGNSIYNEYFYADNRYGSVMSAREVFKVILPKLDINSMIDFGCGTGTWLYVAKKYGVSNVCGIDGDYIDHNSLMIKEEEFIPYQLQNNIDLKQKFDMVISLEAAEHLEEKYAENFIDNLCRHGDIILFSAAHVGQKGDGHINEQPFEYWKEKFITRGYKLIEIRDLFKDNWQIETWYKQNIGLYVKEGIEIDF